MSWARRLAVVAPVTAVAALLASFLPFVSPRTGDPSQADAVVVLSGDHGERLPLALDLIRRGVTSTLVFAGALDSAQAIDLCKGGQPFEVICLSLNPDSTREEARATSALAARRGWGRVVVATTTYHVPRSRLLFDRCTDAEVVMVAADLPRGGLSPVRATVREWLGVLQAKTLSRTC